MKSTASEAEIANVIERVEVAGVVAHPSTGEAITIIGAIGDREHVGRLDVAGAPRARARPRRLPGR